MRRFGVPISRLARRAQRYRWTALDATAGVQRRVTAGTVALTFDDGPHPASTDPLLDLLAELDVKATFFCVGKNAEAHPDIVRRARAEGHLVGSHSYSHPHPRDTRLATLAQEYARGRQAVATVLGDDTDVFRPPHGHLKPTSSVMVRRQGLRPWLWTVDPEDWRPGVTVAQIRSVAGGAVSGDVVLLHDWVEEPMAPEALDRSATIAAVPGIVADIRARGLALGRLQP